MIEPRLASLTGAAVRVEAAARIEAKPVLELEAQKAQAEERCPIINGLAWCVLAYAQS